MFGGFQKQLAVNAGRKAGDDNRRYILQREFAFALRRFAGQLAVFATKRALRRVYADDVVGHDAIPVSGVFKTSKPHLSSVATETC